MLTFVQFDKCCARRHRKPEEAWAAWARSIFACISECKLLCRSLFLIACQWWGTTLRNWKYMEIPSRFWQVWHAEAAIVSGTLKPRAQSCFDLSEDTAKRFTLSFKSALYIYIYTYFCFLESLARRPWKTTLPCSFQALATGPTPGYVERHNVLSWSGSGSKPIKLSGFTFQKTRWPDGVVGTTISRKPWQPCVSDQACIRQLAWVMVQWCAARECYRHAKTSNLNSHFHDSCNIFKFSVGIILQSN